jgi:hypothetical protein
VGNSFTPNGTGGALADLLKPKCFGLFGFSSGSAAQNYLNNVTFIAVNLGNLQVSSTRAGLQPTLNTPPPAEVNGFGTAILINTAYNWSNFSQVTATVKATGKTTNFDYLAGVNGILGSNMTSDQLATLIVLHELRHLRGAPQETSTRTFNLPILQDCIQ